jgi:hypothetical protein
MCVQANGKLLPRWGNQTDSGQEKTTPGEGRWLERSKTWPGIAAAMGDQWGRYLNEIAKAASVLRPARELEAQV